ncbi:hypothetical protein [Lysobacter sp. CA199]|uniref:hypothetical protein n=1 Tax=Lysobacter sp. CA199 TaxID=3455608 RepID=UPI003F8D12F0
MDQWVRRPSVAIVACLLAAVSLPAWASDPGVSMFAMFFAVYLVLFALAYSLIWAVSFFLSPPWRWLARAVAIAAFFAPGFTDGWVMPAVALLGWSEHEHMQPHAVISLLLTTAVAWKSLYWFFSQPRWDTAV